MTSLSSSVEGQLSLLQDVDACGKKDSTTGKNTFTLQICDGGEGPYVVVKTERFVLTEELAMQLASTISFLTATVGKATEVYEAEAEEEEGEEPE